MRINSSLHFKDSLYVIIFLLLCLPSLVAVEAVGQFSLHTSNSPSSVSQTSPNGDFMQ